MKPVLVIKCVLMLVCAVAALFAFKSLDPVPTHDDIYLNRDNVTFVSFAAPDAWASTGDVEDFADLGAGTWSCRLDISIHNNSFTCFTRNPPGATFDYTRTQVTPALPTDGVRRWTFDYELQTLSPKHWDLFSYNVIPFALLLIAGVVFMFTAAEVFNECRRARNQRT